MSRPFPLDRRGSGRSKGTQIAVIEFVSPRSREGPQIRCQFAQTEHGGFLNANAVFQHQRQVNRDNEVPHRMAARDRVKAVAAEVIRLIEARVTEVR